MQTSTGRRHQKSTVRRKLEDRVRLRTDVGLAGLEEDTVVGRDSGALIGLNLPEKKHVRLRLELHVSSVPNRVT